MANATHWTYATEAEAREVQEAFGRAEALPRRGAYRRKRSTENRRVKRPRIPKNFRKDAPGWSKDLVNVDARTNPSRLFAIQNASECAAHYGKSIRISGNKQIVLPTAGTAVARNTNEEWAALPSVPFDGGTKSVDGRSRGRIRRRGQQVDRPARNPRLRRRKKK